MILTRDEQLERWPNIMALMAGIPIEVDLSKKNLKELDALDKKVMYSPGFMSFLNGIIGPAHVKQSKGLTNHSTNARLN